MSFLRGSGALAAARLDQAMRSSAVPTTKRAHDRFIGTNVHLSAETVKLAIGTPTRAAFWKPGVESRPPVGVSRRCHHAIGAQPSGCRDVRCGGVSDLSGTPRDSHVLQPEGCAPLPVGPLRCLVVMPSCAPRPPCAGWDSALHLCR